MQSLINFNKFLKDIHEFEPNKPLIPPSLVLVGSEGSGKSSFVESLISIAFLPKDIKKIMSLPIEYHFINSSESSSQSASSLTLSIELPNRLNNTYTDIEEFKKQLGELLNTADNNDCGQLTIKLTAPNIPQLRIIEISSAADEESVYSPKYKAMENSMRNYCNHHKNLVFIALFNASKDLSASYLYSILREFDPTLDRTIGVLTMQDLARSSTQRAQITSVLTGKILPLRSGYFLLNCKHAQTTYKYEWASLLNKISKFIANTFRVTLPALHNRLQEKLLELEERLVEVGEPLKLSDELKTQYVWNLTGDFCYRFRESLAGKYEGFTNRKIQELCLGAIVRMFYHELYNEEDSFFQEPHIKVTADDVLKLIDNLNNSTMDGFISIDAFLCMVGPYLDALMDPVKELLERVFECMKGLAEKLLNRVFFQFPALNAKLLEGVKQFISDHKKHAENIITEVMDANKTYFFTSDREFLRIDIRRLQAINAKPSQDPTAAKQTNKAFFPSQDLDQPLSNEPHIQTSRSSIHQGPMSPNKATISPQQARVRTAEEILIDNKRFLAEEIYRRVRKYYLSIKNNLKDTVPRLIGCFLVKPIHTDLQGYITKFLDTSLRDSEDDLLKESEENAAERENIKQQIDKIRRFRRDILRDQNLGRLIREDYLEKFYKQQFASLGDQLGFDILQSPTKGPSKQPLAPEADPKSLDSRMSSWVAEKDSRTKNVQPSLKGQSSSSKENIVGSRGRARVESRVGRPGKRAKSQHRVLNKQEKNAEIEATTMTSQFVLIENYLNKDQKFRENVISKEEWLKIIDADTLSNIPLQKLCVSAQDGIPPDLRFSIWMLIANAKALKKQHPKNLYEKLTQNPNKWEVQIEKDIPRTYASEDFFKKPEFEAKEKTFRILRAYANYDEELGYTQGMNAIAGMMLMVLSADQSMDEDRNPARKKSLEKNVFWIFVHIMKEKGWRRLLIDGTPKLIDCCIQLDKMMQKQLPEIHAKIEESGLNIDMCFNQYFITLFIYNTPVPLAARILDLFLFRGETALYELIIKALKMFEKEILQYRRMEDLFNFLKTNLMVECFKRYRQALDKVLPEY